MGKGLLIVEDSWSHSDTPQSVGLIWKSDKHEEGTSTWKHTTISTDIHISGGIWTHNHSMRVAVDQYISPRGKLDRLIYYDNY
jgi:hypothetical protein